MNYRWRSHFVILSPENSRIGLIPIGVNGIERGRVRDLIMDVYNLPPEKYERFVKRYLLRLNPFMIGCMYAFYMLMPTNRSTGIRNSLRRFWTGIAEFRYEDEG